MYIAAMFTTVLGPRTENLFFVATISGPRHGTAKFAVIAHVRRITIYRTVTVVVFRLRICLSFIYQLLKVDHAGTQILSSVEWVYAERTLQRSVAGGDVSSHVNIRTVYDLIGEDRMEKDGLNGLV